MNNLDKAYTDLLQDILDNGVEKNTRNGKVLSVFGRQIRHKMSNGFPLLTTKKMYFKGIVTELLWFLKGDTNIKYLVDNGCNIWNGDCYKSYKQSILESFDTLSNDPVIDAMPPRILSQEEFINKIKTNDEFAKKWGDLGPVYGKQWRNWEYGESISYMGEIPSRKFIDQIANLIKDLKTNPDSRRLMVTVWNPADLPHQVLPPCHYSFQVYTRELSLKERENYFVKNILGQSFIRSLGYGVLDTYNTPKRAISLIFNMRSTDVPLGLPFNLASYGLLLSILGEIVNMVPDELIANLGDTHIYQNQIDSVKEQLTRIPFDLPTLRINTEFWPTVTGECGIGKLTDNVDFLIKEMNIDDFQIENYTSHPSIKIPLSN
jgi:thymidylate synthase